MHTDAPVKKVLRATQKTDAPLFYLKPEQQQGCDRNPRGVCDCIVFRNAL